MGLRCRLPRAASRAAYVHSEGDLALEACSVLPDGRRRSSRTRGESLHMFGIMYLRESVYVCVLEGQICILTIDPTLGVACIESFA